MKIYLAGPDVFSPDFAKWRRETQNSRPWADLDIELVFPVDNSIVTPKAIADNNKTLIQRCDAVAANVNPFRGIEPDSGTCFEIGYAAALGKPIAMYLKSGATMRARLGPVDENWYFVEDFGYPVNLMLAESGTLVTGSLMDAIDALTNALRANHKASPKL